MKRATNTPPPSLRDLVYQTIEDDYFFGDVVSPRHGGPSSKYLYFELGKRFLKAVDALVVERVPHFAAKIGTNPGGTLVAGDVSLTGSAGVVVASCSLVYDPLLKHAKLMWRVGQRAGATDGPNHWLEDGSPADVADQIVPALARVLSRPVS